MKKSGFTMIELVFVIVVLGILAAVAVPKLAATRDDAHIATGRSDVASIRSAIINERQTGLFRGDPAFITNATMDTGGLFGGVLSYPITAGTGNGKWAATTAGTIYTYTTSLGTATFTYNQTTGVFDCATNAACNALTD